jgi:hypothetical protein
METTGLAKALDEAVSAEAQGHAQEVPMGGRADQSASDESKARVGVALIGHVVRSPEEIAERKAHHRASDELWGRAGLAQEFAAALLQHPRVDVMLGGMPLEPGAKYDGLKRGAYLADRCWEIAGDFLQRLAQRREAEFDDLKAKYVEIALDAPGEPAGEDEELPID